MYPVTFEADYDRNPDRVTTFFRFILAIPWLIVAYIYEFAGFFTHLFAWVAVVITGRYPESLYSFNSGVIRYLIRTNAYMLLQTDRFPPFGIAPDPTYPVRINVEPRMEKQSRWKALIRIILIIPAYIILYLTLYLHLISAFISWLTIVFRGYQPAGVHNVMTFTNSFYARFLGYFALLTDTYPPVGAEGPQAGDTRPAVAPAAPAAPAVPDPSAAATAERPVPPPPSDETRGS